MATNMILPRRRGKVSVVEIIALSNTIQLREVAYLFAICTSLRVEKVKLFVLLHYALRRCMHMSAGLQAYRGGCPVARW